MSSPKANANGSPVSLVWVLQRFCSFQEVKFKTIMIQILDQRGSLSKK